MKSKVWYVYRHIRLDKNEPFYIGIGSQSNFARAYDTHSRNPIWRSIVKKTQYDVEILLNDLSYETVLEKEREFITLYGRIDEKTGILANMTAGGDGTCEIIRSEETRRRMSNSRLGKKASPETKLKMSKSHTGKVLSPESRQKLSKSRTGMEFSEIHRQNISRSSPMAKRVRVYLAKTDILVGEYHSIGHACSTLGIMYTSGMKRAANDKLKTTHGYRVETITVRNGNDI